MFTIKINDKVVHSPQANLPGLQLIDPVLSTQASAAGTLTFKAPPGSTAYDLIEDDTALITVYNGSDLIWKGRIYENESDFYNIRSVTAEGMLACFNDSLIPPSFWDDIEDEMDSWPVQQLGEYEVANVITRLHRAHNQQVSEFQKLPNASWGMFGYQVFTEDHLTKLRKTDYTSAKTVVDDILSTFGGVIYSTYNSNRLQMMWMYPHESPPWYRHGNQSIVFGKNLIDITKKRSKSDICTVIVPIGTNGLTIEDYCGQAYIEDADAIAQFGKIWKQVSFDTDDDEELYNKALEYLGRVNTPTITISAKAVDLSITDDSVTEFSVGSLVRVYSAAHNIDEELLIQSIRYDFSNPGNSEFTIGTPEKTLV